MLNLSDTPFWLDVLPGLRMQMRPVGTAARLLARQEAQAAHADPEGDGRVSAHIAFVSILVKRGVVAWEGVGEDDGTPVEPTQDTIVRDPEGVVIEVIPGTITRLLKNYAAFDALDAKYVAPVLEAVDEKKGSSPSRSGKSSVTAKPIAPAAAKGERPPAKRARSRKTGSKPKAASARGPSSKAVAGS